MQQSRVVSIRGPLGYDVVFKVYAFTCRGCKVRFWSAWREAEKCYACKHATVVKSD